MRSSPQPWGPTTWGLAFVLAFLIGVWLGLNGYAKPAVIASFVIGSLVQLPESQRQAVIGAFRDALRVTDLGFRKAALHMGLDPSDLRRALEGEQRFDVWRIEMLPDETVRCFYYFRAVRLGLPALVQSALKMGPAFQNSGEKSA